MICDIVTEECSLSEACFAVQHKHAFDVACDLTDTAIAADNPPAAGLAANQIGSSARVIVIKYGDKFIAMANPVIFQRSYKRISSTEGCLSRPGMPKVQVMRNKSVKVRFQDPATWEDKKMPLKGMDAIVCQHEIDHLNGILI